MCRRRKLQMEPVGFPFVLIFGEVEQRAVDELARFLIAFDEIRQSPEILLESRNIKGLPENSSTPEAEAYIKKLMGGLNPASCRGFLIDFNTMCQSADLHDSWYHAHSITKYLTRNEFLTMAVWVPEQESLKTFGAEPL